MGTKASWLGLQSVQRKIHLGLGWAEASPPAEGRERGLFVARTGKDVEESRSIGPEAGLLVRLAEGFLVLGERNPSGLFSAYVPFAWEHGLS